MPLSTKPDFQSGTPPSSTVYEVSPQETSNPLRPPVYAHWSGLAWGAPSFTIESARPATTEELKRPPRKLFWRALTATSLKSTISALLQDKGPQGFDSLLNLIKQDPSRKDTARAELDEALKELTSENAVQCVEGVLSSQLAPIFSRSETDELVNTLTAFANDGQALEQATAPTIEPMTAQPQTSRSTDPGQIVIGILRDHGIMAMVDIRKVLQSSYRHIRLDSTALRDVLTDLVLTGVVDRALAKGKRQSGYLLRENVSKVKISNAPRQGYAIKSNLQEAVRRIHALRGPLPREVIFERINNLFLRSRINDRFVDDEIERIGACIASPAANQPSAKPSQDGASVALPESSGTANAQLISNPDERSSLSVSITQRGDGPNERLPTAPALAPVAQDVSARAQQSESAVDLIATVSQASVAGSSDLRAVMGGLLGGMLDVIQAEVSRTAATNSDAQFFASQDSLIIKKGVQSITLNAQELSQLKGFYESRQIRL